MPSPAHCLSSWVRRLSVLGFWSHPVRGCYAMWSLMSFSCPGGLPDSLTLLDCSGHPKLRLAVTGQHESLTSTLPSWSLGVRRGKPSSLVPIVFSRQTELQGYYGTEQRVSTGCKLLFTVFFSHFSKEAICENRTFSGSSPTKRKCSHMGIWDNAFWPSCPVLAALDPVKRLLFQGQQKQK